MLEAKELRLGNYIYKLDTPVRVEVETFRNVKAMLFPYSPIPITEEILIKCGIERASWRESSPLYLNGNKTSHPDVISISLYSNFCRIKIVDKTVRTLKYLHELQNLYFARTGEDFEIEL